MKICILSIVNIKHMSLISLYTSFFEKAGIKYDIIYIDKYNEEEYVSADNIYRYSIQLNREWSKLKKLSVYWGFKKFAQNIILKNKYDYVIVWRTETALMFFDFLVRKMKGKYCLNIRDYCYEKNTAVKYIHGRVIKHSHFSTISSEGYKSFLPKANYITVHSYNERLLNKCTPSCRLREKNEPIRICFIGYVRFFDIDKKLIDSLGNDPRYIIQFFGEGSHILKEYAESKGIYNLETVSGFRVEETPSLLQKADVINNLYGYNNIALDTAISTKFYYALYMNIPILVFKNTFMELISEEAGLGFAVGSDFSELGDDFYNWYHALDLSEMEDQRMEALEGIKKDNTTFNNMLIKTFVTS